MSRFFAAIWIVSATAATQSVSANDYPTLERVDHVLTCMRLAGGQTVDNLYACACEIDVIAQAVNFDDFTEARTYEIYKRMPGEKGGLFRESEQGDAITAKLAAARADAKKRCFIGVRHRQVKQADGEDDGKAASEAVEQEPTATPDAAGREATSVSDAVAQEAMSASEAAVKDAMSVPKEVTQ